MYYLLSVLASPWASFYRNNVIKPKEKTERTTAEKKPMYRALSPIRRKVLRWTPSPTPAMAMVTKNRDVLVTAFRIESG